MISEPTHSMGSSRSCIDLVCTDQPNVFLETGVHPSLHEQCHHQIIHGKLAMNNSSPASHNRRVWFYYRANVSAIKKSIEMYNWHKSFAEISCPSEQVNLLNQVLTSIFNNFIPNKIVKVEPQQIPWITKTIKSFLRKSNRAYKSFVRSGYSQERSEMIQQMILQGTRLVEEAKQRYFLKIGQKLSRADTDNIMYSINQSINVTSSNSKVVHHVLPRRFIFRQSFGHSHGSTVRPFFNVVTPYSSRSAPSFFPFNVTFQH